MLKSENSHISFSNLFKLEPKQMDLDLFTVHHKDDNNIQVMRKHFKPVQMGCALSSIDLGVRRAQRYFNILMI